MRSLLSASTALVLITSATQAQVSVTQGAPQAIPGRSAITVSYTVTNNSGETMTDFHLKAGKRVKGVPERSDNETPGNGADDFTASKSNGEFHWIAVRPVANGGGTPSGQSTTFSVTINGMTVAEWNRNKQNATWYATNDRRPKLDRRTSVIQSGNNSATGAPITVALAQTGMSVQPLEFGQRGLPLNIQVYAPEFAHSNYAILCSFQDGPGIPLSPLATLPLAFDPLFELSLMNVFLQPHPVFQNFVGTLDPLGNAQAQLLLPPDPLLGGLELHIAGVVIDPRMPELFMQASDAAPIFIQP